MGKKSEIKSGAILGYLNVIIKLCITLIYTPFLISKLGDSEYGLYSLVLSIVNYLSILDLGFGNTLIRYVSRAQGDNDKDKESRITGMFLVLYIGISIIALLTGIVLFFNIESFFEGGLTSLEINKAKVIFIILLFNIVLQFPLSVFSSYANASEKFKLTKTLTLLKTILSPLTMLPVLYFGYKSIALVIVTTVYNLLYYVIIMTYCFKKLDIKFKIGKKYFDKKLFKEITIYSFFIFLNLIIDSIYNNTDQVLLGKFSGTIAVSVYSLAMHINTSNQTISTTISGLFFPKVNKILSEENHMEKLNNIFIKVGRLQLYLLMLVFTGFVVFGKQFINLWTGSEYEYAYYIVILIIGPGMISLTQNVALSIIRAKNMHKFRSVVYLGIAILNIVLSIPLIKLFISMYGERAGGIGAAIGTALGTIIGNIIIMNIYYYKKVGIDIPRYWKFFIKFALAMFIYMGIVYFIVNKFINVTSWLTLLIPIFVYALGYFIITYFFTDDYEKNIYNKIFRKLKLIK